MQSHNPSFKCLHSRSKYKRTSCRTPSQSNKRAMAKTLRVILTFVLLASSLTLQGKSIQNTVKEVKSSTVIDRILMKQNQGNQRIFGTGGTNRVKVKIEDVEERNREKRFISWPGSVMRGLIIQRKNKTEKVEICYVFLAYTLQDKCNILRFRLK